jgi:MSHA biogenesis protein MshQ
MRLFRRFGMLVVLVLILSGSHGVLARSTDGMVSPLATSSSYQLWELEATALDVPATDRVISWDRLFTLYPNDDDQVTLPIGFNFQFGATQYSQVQVLTNGILQFGGGVLYLDYSNDPLPARNGDRFIAVYWDDLVDDSLSSVTWGQMGTAPLRRFVVTWHNVRAYSNNRRYDFQVVLYENGDIRYRYNNNTANGESATIGLEIDSTDYLQYSYDQVSVATSFDLLFRNRSLMLPAAVGWYSLDEDAYTGQAGEVQNSGSAGLSGTAFNGADTTAGHPAITGTIGTCRYGHFDGVDDYLEITDNNSLDLANSLAVGAWVRFDTLSAGDIKTVVSKDENYEFHIDQKGRVYWWWHDSAGNVRTLTTPASLSSGSWHHIVISYRSGSQIIYVDGAIAASSGYSGHLLTQDDPLQIGADQNLSGRYFNGDIDEVVIFDQSLSQYQVLELMAKTRPCTAFNLCISSFPDGLGSYNRGTIRFGENAQLFFSPDDSLYAAQVQVSSYSALASCVSTACSANGAAVPEPPVQTFPATSKGSNVNVPSAKTVSLGSTDHYRNISVSDYATLVFNGGQDEYFIDNLGTSNQSVLQLEPATYWIRSLTLGSNNHLQVTGSGNARVFVQQSVNLGTGLIANSPAAASAGDAGKWLLYGFGDINVADRSTLSGMLYANGNFLLGTGSYLFGAATAANLTLSNNSKVYYHSAEVASADFGAMCASASRCELGGFNIEQPLYGLACPSSRLAVQVQAMCADGITIKDDYAGTLTLSSNDSGFSHFFTDSASGAETSRLVMDGSEAGEQTLYLSHQNETPALRVQLTDLVSGITTLSSHPTDVRASGFLVLQQPEDFICGNTTSMSLVAVGEDSSGTPCQTLSGFSGSKSIKAWFGASVRIPPMIPEATVVSTPLSINGVAITAQSQPASQNLDLSFVAGKADLTLAYSNAAAVLGLNFLYDSSPYDGVVGSEATNAGLGPLRASSNGWVTRPQHIALALADVAVCAAADVSCVPQIRAGEHFNLGLRAECSDGTVASDFRGEVLLSSQIQVPADGYGALFSPDTVSLAAADRGERQELASLDEVGVFSLRTRAGYLGQALDDFSLDGVGRVVPHHFRLLAPAFSQTCGDFTYMGQPGLQAGFHLQAENASNRITRNYQGGLAHASLVWSAENANDGVDLSGRLSSTGTGPDWQAGETEVIDFLTFARGSEVDGPFDDLLVGVNVEDNEGGWSPLLNRDSRPGDSTNCSIAGNCEALGLGSGRLLFGRLQLESALGAEVEDLQQSLLVLYHEGERWLVNRLDHCTDVQLARLQPDNSSWEGNLASGETLPSLLQGIVGGEGIFIHSAPGVDNDGSVLYRYQAPAWLRTENTGDGNWQDDPVGRINFGLYRGSDRVIYWREQKR